MILRQKAFLEEMNHRIGKAVKALCEIYRKQTVYDDPDQIEAAVDALCDDDRATLQTNVSWTKRKLVDKVGRLAADQYAIIRGRDGVYRIAVSRDLVTMSA